MSNESGMMLYQVIDVFEWKSYQITLLIITPNDSIYETWDSQI